MASIQKKVLIESQAFAANFSGDQKSLEVGSDKFIAWIDASAVGAGTSLAVKIQHSPDNGATWKDVIAFTALTAAGSEEKQITTHLFPLVRAVGTFTGGTTTATLKVELFFDPN